MLPIAQLGSFSTGRGVPHSDKKVIESKEVVDIE